MRLGPSRPGKDRPTDGSVAARFVVRDRNTKQAWANRAFATLAIGVVQRKRRIDIRDA